MQINKNTFIRILLFASALLCVAVAYENEQLIKENKKKETELLARWMDLQGKTSLHDISMVTCKDTLDNPTSLGKMNQTDRRLCLYVNRSMCTDCWKVLSKQLLMITDSLAMPRPYLLAEDFSSRNLRHFRNDTTIAIPIIEIMPEDSSVFSHMAKIEKPFLMYLNTDNTISHLMCVENRISPAMFLMLKSHSRKRDMGTGVFVLDTVKYLGTVSYKDKILVRFNITNHTNEVRQIENVRTSCTCITPVETMTSIPAGETIEFSFEFFAETWGEFSKKIRLDVKGQKEPLWMVIKGNVK